MRRLTIAAVLVVALLSCRLPFKDQRAIEIQNELKALTVEKIERVRVLLWVCEGENPVTLENNDWL